MVIDFSGNMLGYPNFAICGFCCKKTEKKIGEDNMKTEKIQEMLLELIKTIDYDMWKYYIPELSEDPDGAEDSMNELITIVKTYLKNDEEEV